MYICMYRYRYIWQSQHKADVYEILSQVFGAVDLRHVWFVSCSLCVLRLEHRVPGVAQAERPQQFPSEFAQVSTDCSRERTARQEP